jgi:hypothetical protein
MAVIGASSSFDAREGEPALHPIADLGTQKSKISHRRLTRPPCIGQSAVVAERRGDGSFTPLTGRQDIPILYRSWEWKPVKFRHGRAAVKPDLLPSLRELAAGTHDPEEPR